MNIIINWSHDRLIFTLSDIFWFLLLMVFGLLLLGAIVGLLSYLVARYVDKIYLKHDIISITIGDNGEKLLLTNASDIEWVKSYMTDMPDCEKVKYVYNHYTEQTYKVVSGIDLALIDSYDEDI